MTIAKTCFRLLAGATLLALPMTANAAVTLTGAVYTENFDTLTTSTSEVATTGGALPNGWQFSEADGNANTSYRAGDGSSPTGDTYSFGAAGQTERALGAVASNSLQSRFGVLFTNGTGSTISSLALAFTNEQWRNGDTAAASSFAFSYRVGATNLTSGTWTTLSALDLIDLVGAPAGTGGAAVNGNQTRSSRSATISGLTLAQGQTIGLRWVDLNDGGADDALAIDDFRATATFAPAAAVPEPATWALMLVGFALVGGVARRRGRARAFA